MARPKKENPTDTTLRIRTHKELVERISAVAKRNHRSIPQESLFAIESHLEREEARLFGTDATYRRKEIKASHLNEDSPKPGSASQAA